MLLETHHLALTHHFDECFTLWISTKDVFSSVPGHPYPVNTWHINHILCNFKVSAPKASKQITFCNDEKHKLVSLSYQLHNKSAKGAPVAYALNNSMSLFKPHICYLGSHCFEMTT